MAIFIAPSHNAGPGATYRVSKKIIPSHGLGSALFGYAPTAYFTVRKEIKWDQVYKTYMALHAMEERAREGASAAANWAARKTRENLIDASAKLVTLDQKRIESLVSWRRGTPENPAALVRVGSRREPLDRFAWANGSNGVTVTTTRAGGAKRIKGSFYRTQSQARTAGIYRRASRGGERVGRLPIEKLYGPRLVTSLRESGVLPEQKEMARRELVYAVMRARDICVDEYGLRWPPPLTEDDPRMNYGWSKKYADIRYNDGLSFRIDRFLESL